VSLHHPLVTGCKTWQHERFINFIGYAEMGRALHNTNTATHRMLKMTQIVAILATQIKKHMLNS
jgi:hypothetical protein